MFARGFNYSMKAFASSFKLLVRAKPVKKDLFLINSYKFSSFQQNSNNTHQKINVQNFSFHFIASPSKVNLAQDDLFKSKLPGELRGKILKLCFYSDRTPANFG